MNEIQDVPVFLSASFPSDDERGRRFPADPAAVADAVAAVSTALLHAGARIVSGGHPTVTPLLLFVCDENGWRDRVVVYQSDFFRDYIAEETWRLAREGYGDLRFTATSGDPEADLATMRHAMLEESDPQAAVFIGGMEGIHEEWKLARSLDAAEARLVQPDAFDAGEILRGAGLIDVVVHDAARRACRAHRSARRAP